MIVYPPLIFQDHPVGIGTVPHKAVAGLHRAYPSTSLDKSLFNITHINFKMLTLNLRCRPGLLPSASPLNFHRLELHSQVFLF